MTSEAVLMELCSALFDSLPRSDQRRRGSQYVRGLLEVPGRKSIRSIAAISGTQGAEQSLHHFITSSTWHWMPVRHALARYLVGVATPQAWVVQSMVIQKAGSQSVGVEKRFIPSLGQVVNAQQAIGVWAASEDVSGPVNWRLHLPETWTRNASRRRMALIPDGMGQEALGESALKAIMDVADMPGIPLRPVLINACELDAVQIVKGLQAARIPFLIRICASTQLSLAEANLTVGSGANTLPAHLIFSAYRVPKYPVRWADGDGLYIRLAAAARVRSLAGDGNDLLSRTDPDLLLISVAPYGQRGPIEFWLTDMTRARIASLFRMSRLTEQVGAGFTEIADQVGIRDFAGRSFTGWHRHVTLASAAYAVVALSRGRVHRNRSRLTALPDLMAPGLEALAYAVP